MRQSNHTLPCTGSSVPASKLLNESSCDAVRLWSGAQIATRYWRSRCLLQVPARDTLAPSMVVVQQECFKLAASALRHCIIKRDAITCPLHRLPRAHCLSSYCNRSRFVSSPSRTTRTRSARPCKPLAARSASRRAKPRSTSLLISRHHSRSHPN
jgi:hypothetical protein